MRYVCKTTVEHVAWRGGVNNGFGVDGVCDVGIQQQADAKDKEVVHEFRALADSVAFKSHINTGDDKLKGLYEAWHNCFDNEATPEGHIVTPDTDILNHDYVPKTPSYSWDMAEGEVGLLGK